MTRVRIAWLLSIAILLSVALPASLAAQAAEVARQDSGSTTVSGVYSVTFQLRIASTLPAGTTITCRARIVPGLDGMNPRSPQPSETPVETAAGMVAVTGPTAFCATEIPFAWTGMNAQGGVMLSYEIDAVRSAGVAPLLVRSSAEQNIPVAFPAAGGSASLSFNVIF